VEPQTPDERSRRRQQERAAWPTPSDARTPAEAQVALILAEYGDYVEPGPPDWRENGIRYFVRRGFVLVRDEHAARARRLLWRANMRPGQEHPEDVRPEGGPREDEWHDDDEAPEDQPRDGDIAFGLRWMRLGRDVSVFEALSVIRDGLPDRSERRRGGEGLGVDAAAPEYLLHIVDHSPGCPSEEPTFVPADACPDPPISPDPCAGRGVRVLVIDTGLDERSTALPWMKGVTGDPDPGVDVANQVIGRYAGHGTFIAGVIRAMAPESEVIVRNGLPAPISAPPPPGQPAQLQLAPTPPGTAFEGQLATALERYLREDDPDVISFSAGTLTQRTQDLVMLNAFHDQVLRRHKGVVIVAAAGNDGGRSHFWPAAGPWTVSVGALSSNWRSRARFSNFGTWVDVYAPGERLVNAYPSGKYTYTEPPHMNWTQQFDGMAIWSGTSFSTPVVAGLIAARMSRTGENARDAGAALVALARRNAIPGVGAVLVPPISDDACGAERHCSCQKPKPGPCQPCPTCPPC
jgi:hypothetical protein